MNFHETVMGHRFYEHTMPELVEILKKIEGKMSSNVPKPNEIFVCCEENSSTLCIECGATNNFCVFTDAERAMKWLTEALDDGKKNKYEPIEYRTISGSVSDHVVSCIPLYYNGDENEDRNYSLVIRKFDISD